MPASNTEPLAKSRPLAGALFFSRGYGRSASPRIAGGEAAIRAGPRCPAVRLPTVYYNCVNDAIYIYPNSLMNPKRGQTVCHLPTPE